MSEIAPAAQAQRRDGEPPCDAPAWPSHRTGLRWCACALGLALASCGPDAPPLPEAGTGFDIPGAIRFIKQDVDYVMRSNVWDGTADQPLLRDAATAIAAMNFVQTRVSSTQYGFRKQTDPQSLPTSVEASLKEAVGLCNMQTSVFMTLMGKLGYPVRSVEFYGESPSGQTWSHVGAEAQFGGKWRYFDISWGTYFKAHPERHDQVSLYDILSFEEAAALSDPDRHRITNESSLAYRDFLENKRFAPFGYLRFPTSILYGKTGTVWMKRAGPSATGQARTYLPQDKPNYIGWVSDNGTGRIGNTSLLLDAIQAPATVTIHASGSVCGRAGGKIRFRSGHESRLVPLPPQAGGKAEAGFAASGDPLAIDIVPAETKQECYLAFTKIDVAPASGGAGTEKGGS